MLLVILLFGIVESSFLFKDYLAVSAAARAGARMGASQPRIASVAGSPDFAQLAANQVTNSITGLIPANLQVVWVYKASATTGRLLGATNIAAAGLRISRDPDRVLSLVR
jgi:Flp pilus assembly protein TadG